MEKKKQTAVEWLINEHFGGIENCTPDFRYHIEQAKAMEKEQIIDAVNFGDTRGKITTYSTAVKYYNEKYER